MSIPIPPDAEEVFRGRLVRVYRWKRKLYDGSEDDFEFVARPDTAQVIVFMDRDTILMTKQEQPHRDGFFYDLPGGRIDKNETMERGIRRELVEETGFDAKRWLEWSRTRWSGLSRYEQGLYVATDICEHPAGRHLDAGEKIEVTKMSFKQAVEMASRRKLRSFDAMLGILQMAYDPESRAKFEKFLSNEP